MVFELSPKENQLKRVYEDSVTEGSTTIVEGTGEIPLVSRLTN